MGLIPEKFAIMAVDPGGTTGVAQALLRTDRGETTKAMLRRAVRKEALKVGQVVAADVDRGTRFDALGQAAAVWRAWRDFAYRAQVEYGVPVPYIFLVIEDFALRQRDAELSPVEVTFALLALLRTEMGTWPTFSTRVEQRLRFQMPSQAMTYATNERLKGWGVYPLTVGKEHARDALRHLALGASRVLQGEWSDS